MKHLLRFILFFLALKTLPSLCKAQINPYSQRQTYNSYVQPYDLNTLREVTRQKQRLYDQRTNTIQQKIYSLLERLNDLEPLDPEFAQTTRNQIDKYINYLNTTSIDYSNTESYNSIVNDLANLDRAITSGIRDAIQSYKNKTAISPLTTYSNSPSLKSHGTPSKPQGPIDWQAVNKTPFYSAPGKYYSGYQLIDFMKQVKFGRTGYSTMDLSQIILRLSQPEIDQWNRDASYKCATDKLNVQRQYTEQYGSVPAQILDRYCTLFAMLVILGNNL